MEYTRYAPFEASSPGEEAARRNHYESELVTESFWRRAAAALPPHVRRKYIRVFEAAEQYEPVVEFMVDGCGKAWSALGRLFHAQPNTARPAGRKPGRVTPA
jgi:hypothetical protein